MATVFCPRPADRSSRSARRFSDWAGFIVFGGFGSWLLLSGWLPIARRSVLAAILLMPIWLGAFFTAIGFLQRRPLIAADQKWLGRAVAHFVTFSIPVYLALMRTRLPPISTGALFVIAAVLLLAASFFALWCTWILRTTMSVEPQARMLITTGPFQYARHPLYIAYVVRVFALVLLYPNVTTAAFMLLWLVCLLYRVRCEEYVLAGCFPEYADFKRRVWMFSPRLF